MADHPYFVYYSDYYCRVEAPLCGAVRDMQRTEHNLLYMVEEGGGACSIERESAIQHGALFSKLSAARLASRRCTMLVA
jgi:hypothetical protein